MEIANTQFEEELSATHELSLLESFESHPVFLQLQFLPFLYADPESHVLVTAPPPDDFLNALRAAGIQPSSYHLLSDHSIPPSTIESWGFSLSVAKWAQERGLEYAMPAWDVVQRVNSKLFSFSEMPLSGASLLNSEEEVTRWIRASKGPKVLKTCFGFAGRGHFLIFEEPDTTKLHTFVEREVRAGRPLIGEPWKERVFDFSTQWKIDTSIHFLGATICESDARGVHKQNSVGKEEELFGSHLHFLDEQKKQVVPTLEKMQRLGYFGNVGIDAMLYRENGEVLLHPLVEINARKTMGWAALAVQRRHFPEKKLSLQFLPRTQSTHNLLPSSLTLSSGKRIDFPRALSLHF